MKKLFFISLFSLNALAYDPKPLSSNFNLNCVTEFPTTSFVSHLKNKNLKFQVLNHNGVELMPIYSGILTTNDISLLIKRAELLKSLSSEAWIDFELSKCESYADKSITCYGEQFIQVNNQKTSLIGKGLSVSYVSSKIMDQQILEIQVSLRLGEINSALGDHEVTMRYSPHECRILF